VKIWSRLLVVFVGAALLAGAAPAQAPRVDLQSVSAQVEVLTGRVTVLSDNFKGNTEKMAELQKLVGQVLDEVRRLGVAQTNSQSNNQNTIQSLNSALDGVKANNDKTAADIRRDLAASVKSLTDSIDKVTQELNLVEGRLDKLSKDVKDSRISVEPLEKPEEVLRQALLDLQIGHYDLAITGLRDFLAKYPTHSGAAEAQLNIGEALFRMNKFDQAITEFDIVWQKYSEPDKSSAALYKRALACVNLNDKASAIQSLNRLKADYPKSAEARLADEKLKELQPAPPPAPRGRAPRE
jgi:tol-pal system protein YbgF